ncbi:unnamed protein product, partial [marine sediment metagenome]
MIGLIMAILRLWTIPTEARAATPSFPIQNISKVVGSAMSRELMDIGKARCQILPIKLPVVKSFFLMILTSWCNDIDYDSVKREELFSWLIHFIYDAYSREKVFCESRE